MLLMLEDGPDRIRRFTRTVRRIDPTLRVAVCRNARAMVREVGPLLNGARLISLNHDLEPEEGSADDPGDGLEVARYLADGPQPCPVIIHSSNALRSTWMAGEFELGGWIYRTVSPIGGDWIEQYWRAVASELLNHRHPDRGYGFICLLCF